MESISSVATFVARSGSAIWARVISTPSHTPSDNAHSAWPTSTTDPCRNTAVVTGTAARTARHTSMLNPVGSWKSGRVFSTEKIEPRTTTT